MSNPTQPSPPSPPGGAPAIAATMGVTPPTPNALATTPPTPGTSGTIPLGPGTPDSGAATAGNNGSIWKSVEAWAALGILALSGFVSWLIVVAIPVVTELPEDLQTPLEYVVNEAVARFGAPVVFLLFLSAAATLVAHNGGKTRESWELWSKMLAFGAACFSFWAGFVAVL